MKSFNNLMLKEGKTIYNLGATGHIFKRLEFSIPNYLEQLTKKKIKINYLILPESDYKSVKKLKMLI